MKLSPAEVWITIFLLFAMVVALRCSFLVLPRRYQPKGAWSEALSFAPLAALVAICAPEIAKVRMEAFTRGGGPALLDNLGADWRLWSAVAVIITMVLARSSKRAALYGLIAAALTSALIKG